MGKQPYIPLYIGDWEQDTNMLSLEAEGGWLKIIFKMFKGDKTGIYKISTKALQNLWRKTPSEITEIVKELLDANVCIIETYKDGYVFTNRRMNKEYKISEIRSKAVQNRYKDDTKHIHPLEYENNNTTLTTVKEESNKRELESNYLKENEEPIVDDGTLSPKMLACFKNNFPAYQIDFDNDYKNCIELAKKIAKFKNWKVASVVNGKMDDCLKSWETIILWVKNDDYYSQLSLSFLNKQWSGLIQKMSKNKKNGTHKQIPSSKSAGAEKLLGQLKDELGTNEFNG